MEPAPEPELAAPASLLMAPPTGPTGSGATYPDPSSWLREVIDAHMAGTTHFLEDSELAAVEQQVGVGLLREALGEKLRSDEEWEMNPGDWDEVDDLVQHYCMLRDLRRPPFWDRRPIIIPPLTPGAAEAALPVLVISLLRRTDRREFIDAHMARSSIDFEYFDATDGSTVDLEGGGEWRVMAGWELEKDDPALCIIPGLMVRSHIPWWHNVRYSTRPVTVGEAGCSISHIRAWREISSRALSAAAVLEDHSAICPTNWEIFLSALSELNGCGFEWDLIYLGVGIWLGDRSDLNHEPECGGNVSPTASFTRCDSATPFIWIILCSFSFVLTSITPVLFLYMYS